jgi:hypothetical protein
MKLSLLVMENYKSSFYRNFKQVKAEVLERKKLQISFSRWDCRVRVINSSGQPGADATVKIRGIGSVNANSDPLYVVDGVPLLELKFDKLRYRINNGIKDASATSIYGSRGAKNHN